ncbi:MAG: hypothetical protein J0H43_00960, partial [Actinobacteria bacterium]|nr:hypothetical protein [Actinomycetota bacterium]
MLADTTTSAAAKASSVPPSPRVIDPLTLSGQSSHSRGASGASAWSRSAATGSGSYSTSISSSASSATYRSTAATAATPCPTHRTRSPARAWCRATRCPGIAVRIIGCGPASAVSSAAVITSNTPGSSRARLTSIPGQRVARHHALAGDRVLWVGQGVAAVAAVDRYVAEDALELIEVEYEPLPVAADLDQALAPDAPRLCEDWPDNVSGSITL